MVTEDWVLRMLTPSKGEVRNVPLTPAARMEEKFSEDERPGHAAWTDGDWKLHRLPARDGAFRYELYHLGEDPAETIDVLAQEVRPAVAG